MVLSPTNPASCEPPPGAWAEPDLADQLVYAISHDLQGPLVNLRGFLGRLQQGCASLRAMAQQWPLEPAQRQLWEGTLDDRVLRSVEIVDRNARRLQQRIGALLELSRTGRGAVCLERVCARSLGQAIAAEYQAAAGERGAALEAGPAPDVLADRERLAAVLRELLSNALTFLHSGRPGAVHLGGQASGSEGHLWVRDNGIGLRPGDLERIFQPFGRVRERETSGVGTGLAKVRKLMRQQGGRAWVESVPGQGSTFYLSLPLAP